MPRLGLASTLAVLGLLAALAPTACALGVAAASGGGSPSSRDAAVSAAYLRARQRVMRAVLSGMPAGVARLRRYEAAFDAECAGVLSGAPKLAPPTIPGAGPQTPESKAAGEFWVEVLVVSVDELTVPAEPAATRSAQAIERLRWSSRQLTRLVRQEARRELAEAHAPAAELCADARAWAASGFRETSPATRRLVARSFSSSESPQEAIGRRLRRYEDRAGRALAQRLQALEERVTLQLLRHTDPIHL